MLRDKVKQTRVIRNNTKKLKPIDYPIENVHKHERNESCICGSGKKFKKCCMK